MTFIFNGGGLYFTGHGCPLRIVAMCKHNLDLACVQGKNTLSDEIIPQTFKTYMMNRYEWIQYQSISVEFNCQLLWFVSRCFDKSAVVDLQFVRAELHRT